LRRRHSGASCGADFPAARSARASNDGFIGGGTAVEQSGQLLLKRVNLVFDCGGPAQLFGRKITRNHAGAQLANPRDNRQGRKTVSAFISLAFNNAHQV
jgi:hypothetical protein